MGSENAKKGLIIIFFFKQLETFIPNLLGEGDPNVHTGYKKNFFEKKMTTKYCLLEN
jgi:hypothetical protein